MWGVPKNARFPQQSHGVFPFKKWNGGTHHWRKHPCATSSPLQVGCSCGRLWPGNALCQLCHRHLWTAWWKGPCGSFLVGQTSRRRFLVGFQWIKSCEHLNIKKNSLALLFTTYIYLPCQHHHDFEDPKHIKLRFLNPQVFRLIAGPTWCGLGWTRQTSWAKKLKIDNLISVTPSAA